MIKLIRLTMTLVFFCFLVACSLVAGKQESQKVAEAFFQDRIMNGDLGKDKYYSEIFWQYTNNQDWNRIKSLVGKALGDIKSYSLNTWNIETKASASEISGTFVMLVYNTVCEKGKGQEALTLHKKFTKTDYKIIRHIFISDEIDKLVNKGIEQVVGEGV